MLLSEYQCTKGYLTAGLYTRFISFPTKSCLTHYLSRLQYVKMAWVAGVGSALGCEAFAAVVVVRREVLGERHLAP